jgi:hypothetical protein
MGEQKPLELLAEMLQICPWGKENSVFFNCLFLQKLPRELCILLSISVQADQIRTHNAQLHHDTVAISSSKKEDQDGSVLAI